MDEVRKVQNLRLVLDGNIGVYREPESAVIKRSKFIENSQTDLTNGKINCGEFLQRMTCRNNGFQCNLANFDKMLPEYEYSNDDSN